MHPTERPPQDGEMPPELIKLHLDGDGHKSTDSTLLTFLVLTLGFTLAITLAALHLAGGW